MKLVDTSSDQVVVRLSREEIVILNNALNEVCNAFGHDEFQTRMGATVREARLLLKEINQLSEHH